MVLVGALTVVHATGALAGREAASVWTLGAALVVAAILANRAEASRDSPLLGRLGRIALSLVAGVIVLGVALYGLDLALVQPLRLTQTTAGAVVGVTGAVILLAAGYFPRRRG